MRSWEFIYISSSPLIGNFWNVYIISRSSFYCYLYSCYYLLLLIPSPFLNIQRPWKSDDLQFSQEGKQQRSTCENSIAGGKQKSKQAKNINKKPQTNKKTKKRHPFRHKNISWENACRTGQHLVFGLTILSQINEPHLCGLLLEDVNSSSPNNVFMLKSALAKHDIKIFCLTQERIPFALGTIQCYLLPSNLNFV